MLRWVILRMAKKREQFRDIKLYYVINLYNQLIFYSFQNRLERCSMWNSEINAFKFSKDFSYLKFDAYFEKTKMPLPKGRNFVLAKWE